MELSPSPDLRTRRWHDDRAPLAIAGVALIGLALVLAFVELALPLEAALLLASLGAVVAVFLAPPKLSALGLVAVAGVGSVWHATTPVLPVTLALLAVGAGGVLQLALYGRAAPDRDAATTRAIWLSSALAILAASFAGYYHFITLGVGADQPLRRLVLTLTWMVTGIVGMALGGQRGERGPRDAGVLFVLVALGKTLAYDLTHLGGLERIALLVLAGGAMLVGARTARPRVEA